MNIVQCDLEYARNPVGFPVDVANSVPHTHGGLSPAG